MKIIFSENFKKNFKKIKDKKYRIKIIKQLQKLSGNSNVGKPLRYKLKSYRTIRIKPFRIIYKIENNQIIVNNFEHLNSVYNN
ncbi:MAG: type II toxin-antitoxin system RelE/ParE family toxin [Nanoarchaeota archaeon]